MCVSKLDQFMLMQISSYLHIVNKGMESHGRPATCFLSAIKNCYNGFLRMYPRVFRKKDKNAEPVAAGDVLASVLAGLGVDPGQAQARHRLAHLWENWSMVMGADLGMLARPLGHHRDLLLIGAEDYVLWDTAKYICRMEKRLAEKPHECEVETAVYAHGTHFVFPEGMLKIMLPVGAGLFVRLAFQAAKQFPEACRQTRQDIDRRVSAAIHTWTSTE